MVIFSAIASAVAIALGGSLIASAVGYAVAYVAAQFAITAVSKYLFKQPARQFGASDKPNPAVRGEIQIGGDVPVSSVYGQCKLSGHRIGYWKWGKGNKNNADVFVLSNGECDGLSPHIYFYGRRYALKSVDTVHNEAERWTIEGWEDIFNIRFYSGAADQGHDHELVSQTNGLGREWTADKKMRGLCYVAIFRQYDKDKWKEGIPDFEFRLKGRKLYDPRKDSTNGGSGAHRMDDPSTWQYDGGVGTNPALQRLDFQLGLLKGIESGRTLIGEGKAATEIDWEAYATAADVCDTDRTVGGDTFKTYQAHTIVYSADDVNQVLDMFDDAMAGFAMNRRGLAGVLAGAAYATTYDLTDADIRRDRPIWRRKQVPGDERVNTLSGQFTSIEDRFRPADLKTIKSSGDIAADGAVYSRQLDLLQVTHEKVAQYILAVRYRQGRRGGMARVPVSWRAGFKVEPGDWITWEGGTWQVQGKAWENDHSCTLTLIETATAVYSGTGVPDAPVIVEPDDPTNPYEITTVSGFAVAAGLITGANGQKTPALEFTWTNPADPSITGVVIQYRKQGAATWTHQTTASGADPVAGGSHIVTDNVVGGVVYQARATINTIPDRLTTWTSAATTSSPTSNPKINLQMAADDLAASLADIVARVQSLEDTFIEGEHESTAMWLNVIARIQSIGLKADSALAQVRNDRRAQAETNSAFADDITTALSRVGDVWASGNLVLQSQAVASGALSRVGLLARAGEAGEVTTAALLLEALSNGESRVLLRANQTVFVDDANRLMGGFDAKSGRFYSPFADIGDVRAGRIRSNTGRWDMRLDDDIFRFNGKDFLQIVGGKTRINTDMLFVDSDQIAAGAISQFAGGAYKSNLVTYAGGSFANLKNMAVTVNVPAGANVEVTFNATASNSTNTNSTQFQVTRDNAKLAKSIIARATPGTASAAQNVALIGQDNPPAGRRTYRVQWRVTGGTGYCTERYLSVKIFKK